MIMLGDYSGASLMRYCMMASSGRRTIAIGSEVVVRMVRPATSACVDAFVGHALLSHAATLIIKLVHLLMLGDGLE